MTHKLLCCGDVHLGCSPSRIPADSNDPQSFSPRAVLSHIPSLAKQHGVDAVVIPGDVCDSRGAYLEGYSALSKLLAELNAIDVPLLTVAGNHDYSVLPKLARELNGLVVLGEGTKWSSHTVEFQGKPPIRFVGRSFADRYHGENPFENFAAPETDIPTVGILHCDVGAQSLYLPTPLSDFQRSEVSTWVLGHIHKPQILLENPFVFYPGSPQGLDPSEHGAHGVWLLELEDGVVKQHKELPIASLRYQNLEVNLTNTEQIDHIQLAIQKSVKDWSQNHQSELAYVRHVILRLSFRGQTESPTIVSKFIDQFTGMHTESLMLEIDGITFSVDKIVNNTQPKIDLSKLAEQSDPPGLLAKQLLRIDSQNSEDLLNAAKQSVNTQFQSTLFSVLDEESLPDTDTLRSLLVEVGFDLLGELLSQENR